MVARRAAGAIEAGKVVVAPAPDVSSELDLFH